jgi:chemotaxis family two-component system sensor kinase Cph1
MTAGPGSQWLSEREHAAELESGTSFDLAECVREPIHRLGGVQSYGALVAVLDGHIDVASTNTLNVLGVAAEDLIGTPIVRLLGQRQLAAITTLLDAEIGASVVLPVVVDAPGGPRAFDVTVHHADGRQLCEFEPAADSDRLTSSLFHAQIRQTLVRLQRAGSVRAACQAAVREVRAVTGYDRVVAYRFESPDGPGEVVAEDAAAGAEPWTGLWFPASDIPPQARRLYEKNGIRVIADVDDPSARLVPAVLPESGEPLDLSLSVLRTVSPFHLEYLRNIGVTSSMSVSLLVDGRLWGLIACHGLSPNRLSPEVRAACEFFGVALSLHVAALREQDEVAARERARKVIARLRETITSDVSSGWAQGPAGLDDVIASSAVVVRVGARVTVHGVDPGPGAVNDLLAALPPLSPAEPWHSDHLGEALPVLAKHAGSLAGALVLPLGGAGDCIAWLRPERTMQRRWATDPAEPVRLGPGGARLTPRGSAAVFRAAVRGRSEPWTMTDTVMAAELGRSVVQAVLSHVQAVAALNDELSRSNVDLNSFAHAAAHDLKEPLRGIAHSAAFIVEDAGTGLDALTSRRLDSIQRLATRMDELLNSLLYYSRLGRSDLQREDVDLHDATLRALEVAGPRLAEAGVRVAMPAPGEVICRVDPVRLDEVLVNLLVNAAKYAQPGADRQVTVGGAAVIAPGLQEPGPAVFVADNGIGIPPHLRDEAFQLFKRLHPPGEYGGGSGAGLAIVRRIVERHGGQAWAESFAAGGTTIWLTFPPGVAHLDRQ